MNNITLLFQVKNQEVINKTRSNTVVVAQSKNLYYAEFIFSELWDGVAKHVQFSKSGVETADVLIVDGIAKIPNTMCAAVGTITVSVYGGNLATSTPAEIEVTQSSYDQSAAAPADDPEALHAYVQTPTGTDEVQYIKRENGVLKYYNGGAWISLLDAYQSAVSGGYTGTQAEFEAMLATLPTYSASASASAAAAAAAGTAAQAAQLSAETAEESAMEQAAAALSSATAAAAAQTASQAAMATAQAASETSTAQAASAQAAKTAAISASTSAQTAAATAATKAAEAAASAAALTNVYTKTESDSVFSNALRKTAENTASYTFGTWNNLVVDDSTPSNANKLFVCGYGKQRQTPDPGPNTPQPIMYGTGSVLVNGVAYTIPDGVQYGVAGIESDYDIISGIGTKRADRLDIYGTSTDGTWSAQENDGTKFAYKLVNPDFGMLPAAAGPYGEIVLCNYFASSGRSFYLPATSPGTVSPVLDNSTQRNLNAFIFTVGAATVYNSVTYDTSTLSGFLTMLQAMRVTISGDTYPTMYLIYIKAAYETVTGTPKSIRLTGGTNTLSATRRKLKISYNQDINKKIAELEAAIASSTAGI